MIIQFKTKLHPNEYAMLAHANEVRLNTDSQMIKEFRRQLGHNLITSCGNHGRTNKNS